MKPEEFRFEKLIKVFSHFFLNEIYPGRQRHQLLRINQTELIFDNSNLRHGEFLKSFYFLSNDGQTRFPIF